MNNHIEERNKWRERESVECRVTNRTEHTYQQRENERE